MLREYRGVAIGAVVLGLVLSAGYGGYCWLKSSLSDASIFDIEPTLVEFHSPVGQGIASFVRESAMTDSSVYFYIRDSAQSAHPLFVGGNPLGYATDGEVEMVQAVWSGDGSVVAVRAKDGEGAQHKYGVFFVDAYDFKAHRPVGTRLPVRTKSQTIKKLLQGRGGEGDVVLKHPYGDESEVVLSRKQAEEFKRPKFR